MKWVPIESVKVTRLEIANKVFDMILNGQLHVDIEDRNPSEIVDYFNYEDNGKVSIHLNIYEWNDGTFRKDPQF